MLLHNLKPFFFTDLLFEIFVIRVSMWYFLIHFTYHSSNYRLIWCVKLNKGLNHLSFYIMKTRTLYFSKYGTSSMALSCLLVFLHYMPVREYINSGETHCLEDKNFSFAILFNNPYFKLLHIIWKFANTKVSMIFVLLKQTSSEEIYTCGDFFVRFGNIFLLMRTRF